VVGVGLQESPLSLTVIGGSTMLAVEFGKKYHSCVEAVAWRESLGPSATQADAYLACERGDWLVWQLTRDPATAEQICGPLGRAIDLIIARAVSRQGRKNPWLLTSPPAWAVASATMVAGAEALWEAERMKACANEREIQAEDIRREIPEWPGE